MTKAGAVFALIYWALVFVVWGLATGHHLPGRAGTEATHWASSYLYSKANPWIFGVSALACFALVAFAKKKQWSKVQTAAKIFVGTAFKGVEIVYFGLFLAGEGLDFLGFWWVIFVFRFLVEDLLYRQQGQSPDQYHPWWR